MRGVEAVKRKGFIFTFDSVGAIAIVIALGVVWVMLIHYESDRSLAINHKTAQDATLVNIYTGVKENDDLDALQHVIDMNVGSGVCKRYFTYDAGTIKEHTHCEEIR